MKKILAITILITSMMLILFLIIGCFNPIPCKKIIEEAREEENIEKVEKDPEESETSTVSDIDDEDNDTNGEVTETSQEDILASIPVYPNIAEVYKDSYDQDEQRYSLFAYTDDAPETVYNWYKDKSKLIGWEIWKEYDEGEGFIAMYRGFRLVITVVHIEDDYWPDTRITVNVK